MYEVDSDRFTSKPNPKKEFTLYFKESGAAAALQKAMLLLYRMPVKPTNLPEFFSQYFENGAQQLARISLLKAELCYKRDELENKQLKVKESEVYIKQMIDDLGLSDEEFILKFAPEQIKENGLGIIERYTKDTESRGLLLQKTLGADDTISKTNSFMDPKLEIIVSRDSNYDFENDCLKNVRSDHALKEDIKELDPWGIICKCPKTNRGLDDGKKSALSFAQDIYVGPGTRASQEEQDPDDDDATSLAELFQQSSRDWVIRDHDENDVKLHNRLLMIKRADKIRMPEFLGWTPLQSREKLPHLTAAEEEEQFVPTNVIHGSKDMKSLYRRPCSQRGADQIISHQTPGATDVNPHEPDNDSFLLEEDHLEHVNKMRETTQESFDYEFKRWSREPRNVVTEEICVPVCEVADISQICPASRNSTDSIGALYAEDDSMNESLGFIPGKMANWTSQYLDYRPCSAGEYFEFGGENEYFHACDQSGQVEDSKALPEIPMTRIDSSCHCVFTGIYDAGDMLNENNEGKEEEKNEQETAADQEDRRSKTRGGKLSLQKDEATLTDESVLENELFEVFKQKQNGKASVKKSRNEEEQEESVPQNIVDVFGIDLVKEVRRTFLE